LAERIVGGNLLQVAAGRSARELIERLAGSDVISIERIVSTGQATPAGEWLVQDRDEWVVLLEGEAELAYEDGSRLRLSSGDHVLIPSGERHRVESTREHPPCISLAVHTPGLRGGDCHE
jgi:cupin 2 domain-containing protein